MSNVRMATTVAGCLTAYFRVHEYRAMVVLVILALLAEISIVSGDAVHLTMVTPTPYAAGSSVVTLSCFRSNPDADISLSFGRPFPIGIPGSTIQTSTTLPDDTYESVSGQAITQYLPISLDSTGLFYCEGSNRGLTTRVYNIIHTYSRKFEPVGGLVTETVNKGEDVTLSVISIYSGQTPLWRRIRSGTSTASLDNLGGQHAITVSSSEAIDGDLYAVIGSGIPLGDNHFSMIRLIVRGCTAGKWGHPACVGVCDMCYNGGVCDDETGQCICAPGFSGPNCLTSCGMHRFGWNCEFLCGTGQLIYSCTGSQFGLPDPYGSSCISGYSGRDCDTACTDGTFGAGCTQTCHCRPGTCDRFTGICGFGCAAGWSGINCQSEGSETVNINGCQVQGVTTTAAMGATTSPVYWTEPTAADAFGQQITNLIRTHQPGDVFNVGQSTQVTYTFTTSSGQQDTCIFSVTVNRAVNINGCPVQGVSEIATGTTTAIYWTEPTATDAFGQQITNITRTNQPGDSFIVGQSTQVTYTFTTSSGQWDTCIFSVTVNRECPDGYFGDDCTDLCHCLNDGKCGNTGYCIGGVCASGFRSDSGNNNCQTGIIEFQMTMTNPGQDVEFSCAATSGDVLTPGELLLTSGSDVIMYTDTSTEGKVLNNTFTLSGLQQNQQLTCFFNHNGQSSTTDSVSFFELPYLSQQPTLNSGSTAANVMWNTWGSDSSDTGDGPIIAYKVYYTPASPQSWISAGNVSVTDKSQAMYSFIVEGLEPSTEYIISIAAVRDGQGGEGPMSPTAVIQTLVHPPATMKPPETTGTMTATQMSQDGSNTVLIAAVTSVIVVVVIVALVILIYFLRVRKHRRQQPSKPQESIGVQELTSYENAITQEPTTSSDYKKVGIDQPSAYEPVGVGSSSTYEDVGLPTWAKPWSVLWVDMMVGSKVLGEGHFGEVRLGGVMIEGEVSKAAIKNLKAHASPTDRQNFLEEFRTMTLTGRHLNVIRILGACQHEDVLYVALEYLPNGDLRSYLRKARSTDDGSEASLSSEKLIQFALGVAEGMQHLAASGVIHRDLAARNILLDNNLVAKVSDFGLSRGEDIYVQMSKTRVPTRWLSLESLTSQTYTSKSDVWSYGILLWEIATLGGTPYSDIKTQFLRSRLENGYRMPKPSNCDDKIYDIMLQCWQEDPNERPSFKKLVSVLTKMADDDTEKTYMRLLSRSEEDMYMDIHPELDDN